MDRSDINKRTMKMTLYVIMLAKLFPFCQEIKVKSDIQHPTFEI